MNFDEIVVKESPGICRCCLSEGCYKDLGAEYTWMNETEVYADMLLDCFDIGITQHNDGPNGAKRLICEVCITRLRDACNFKKQVVDCEKRFIDMLARGEFRPKVLLYQPQSSMKEESLDETAEDVLAADIEYLEDMDYVPDDEEIKTEAHQSTSAATTSSELRSRGRPKKEEDRPDKVKKQKVTKGPTLDNSEDDIEDISTEEENYDSEEQNTDRLVSLRENVIKVVLNSTVMPFRWLVSSYRCFYCYDIYETVAELKAHHLLHDSTEITRAMQKFWDNSVFVDISHISCTKCDETQESLSDLVDHLIANHDVQYNEDTKHCFKPFILKDDEVICAICDLSFQVFSQLLIHASKEHTTPADCICDICGRSFKKHQFKMHVYNEHRSKHVNCTQCGEVFSAYAIRTHMVKAHGRNIKCKMCDETFKTHYKKQQHMTRVHRTRDEIKCPHCPKRFYFPSTMNRHVREYHLQEKNVICSFCGYKTYSLSRLKVHMVKHKDKRDVPCNYCNAKFKCEKSLKQHCQISHADDEDLIWVLEN